MKSARKDAMGRWANVVHRTIFNATKGRLLGKFYGMPVVVLETTGRKTGKKRQTMLTSPVQDGDSFVLVASWGGDDRHPTWFLNLKANPEVGVTMSGSKRTMRARQATAEEKAELWPRVTKQYKGYAGYQTKTDRDIPLVVVEP